MKKPNTFTIASGTYDAETYRKVTKDHLSRPAVDVRPLRRIYVDAFGKISVQRLICQSVGGIYETVSEHSTREEAETAFNQGAK